MTQTYYVFLNKNKKNAQNIERFFLFLFRCVNYFTTVISSTMCLAPAYLSIINNT